MERGATSACLIAKCGQGHGVPAQPEANELDLYPFSCSTGFLENHRREGDDYKFEGLIHLELTMANIDTYINQVTCEVKISKLSI